jgi:WD40 repeat protein
MDQKKISTSFSPGVTPVAFTADGSRLATIRNEDEVVVLDARTGKPSRGVLRQQGSVSALAFSGDGARLAVATEDHRGNPSEVRVWDVVSGRPSPATLLHRGRVLALAFSPDGRTLATGCADSNVRLWETATGKPRVQPMPHQGEVSAVAFTPDGWWLLSAGQDHTVRLWEVATGKTVGAPYPHPDPVLALAADGRTFAAATGNTIPSRGLVQLWKLPSPWQGSAERAYLWARVITGMELTADGAVRALEPEEWQALRERLR